MMKLEHNFDKEESIFVLNVLIPMIKELDIKKSNKMVFSNKYRKYIFNLCQKDIKVEFDNGDWIRCCVANSVKLGVDKSEIEVNYEFLNHIDMLEKEMKK